MLSICIRARPTAVVLGLGNGGSPMAVARMARASRFMSTTAAPSALRTLGTRPAPPAGMPFAVARSVPKTASGYMASVWVGLSAFCASVAAWSAQKVWCEEPNAGAPPPLAADAKPSADEPLPDPYQQPSPKSIVDAKQLGFGTVAGICAGMFVKKGLKLIAFALGGIYILLQYMGSQVCALLQLRLLTRLW